jgi:hypothetical protein
MKRKILVAAIALGLFLSPAAVAQQPSIISKPVAERTVTELPTGPLFWRVEIFPTMAEAQAASGPHGLITEAAGKVWLFTLGPQGQGAPRGNKVAEIGPLPTVSATQYLLRVNPPRDPFVATVVSIVVAAPIIEWLQQNRGLPGGLFHHLAERQSIGSPDGMLHRCDKICDRVGGPDCQ